MSFKMKQSSAAFIPYRFSKEIFYKFECLDLSLAKKQAETQAIN